MNFKLLVITFLIGLGLTACNSNSTSKKVTTATPKYAKATDPIPQDGGYSNIDNAKLQQLMDQGVMVVDIRRQEEWQQTGIVNGAKTITFFDDTGRINPNFVPEFTAITDREKPVILICRTGNRTVAASRAIAQQLGYNNVLNVTHGIMGWISEKRPVVRYSK